jgi:hypothetical protein
MHQHGARTLYETELRDLYAEHNFISALLEMGDFESRRHAR